MRPGKAKIEAPYTLKRLTPHDCAGKAQEIPIPEEVPIGACSVRDVMIEKHGCGVVVQFRTVLVD